MTTRTRPDRLAEAHTQLIEAVAALVSSEDWARFLAIAARFHNYSFHNQLLILTQRPDATRVAGFHTWRKLGRRVRRGEKGLQILAPCIYTKRLEKERQDEPTEVRVLSGFKVVYVFDISQTDGEELPEMRPALLSGAAPEGLWQAIASQIEHQGFTVERGPCPGRANGVASFDRRTVIVHPDLDSAQALKTLIHELAHVMLHEDSRERRRAEVEAESVAFIVCRACQLPSDDYTFPYVAAWSGGDIELVRETGDRVVSCARRILDGLESS